jgi:aminoglycoside 6'-N-acetyltransferase
MNNAITLSPFDARSHAALLTHWLHREHVRRWRLDPDERLAECLEHPNQGGHALIMCDSRPVGYIRWRALTSDELSKTNLKEHHERAMDIDLFIGEEEYTGRGIGPAAIGMLIERLSREAGAGIAGLGASIENKNAIKAFEKAGFRKFHKFHDPVYGTGRLLVRGIGATPSAIPE